MRGLFVGRFQPFHMGHLATVREILARRSDPLVLGIGSAQESFTWDNPFTAGERFEMIDRTLADEGITGALPIPIADIHRHAQWVAYLESMLPPFHRVYTNNPLTRLLFERAGYAVESLPLASRDRWEGAQIRRLLAEGSLCDDRLPKAVVSYLTEIRASDRLRLLLPPSSPGAKA
jgi:nicotinamide-nucleotide adenylyltransferase